MASKSGQGVRRCGRADVLPSSDISGGREVDIVVVPAATYSHRLGVGSTAGEHLSGTDQAIR